MASNEEIKKASELSEVKNKKIRQLIKSNIKNIGTLPTIIKELVEVRNNPWSSAKNLADVISVDPVLSSRLLRLVNSAYYGFVKEIVDIQQAISLVGFNTIRSFAFSMTIFDSFMELKHKQAFSKESFWVHCLGVAMISKRIADDLKMENSGGLFMAGLLHDIGKIFLYQFLIGDFYKVLGLAKTYGISYYDAERLLLDTNHADIGEMVMAEWQLPKSLEKAIATHHELIEDKKEGEISNIIIISDSLCKELQIGNGGDSIASPYYEKLKKMYGISDKYIEDISVSIKSEVEQFSEVIMGSRSKGGL